MRRRWQGCIYSQGAIKRHFMREWVISSLLNHSQSKDIRYQIFGLDNDYRLFTYKEKEKLNSCEPKNFKQREYEYDT